MRPGLFAQAFVAQLIAQGVSAVQPHAPEDRKGFQAVVDLLNAEIDRQRQSGDLDIEIYRDLVRLRNELKASNSGAFDSFETILRDLQLSMTNSPNPFYEEIEFSVSKPYAESMLDELSASQRDLVAKAADAFLRERLSRPLRFLVDAT